MTSRAPICHTSQRRAGSSCDHVNGLIYQRPVHRGIFGSERQAPHMPQEGGLSMVRHSPHTASLCSVLIPTTPLAHKSFHFNRIWHFYVKCFNCFYCHNSLNFKALVKPCISMTCV